MAAGVWGVLGGPAGADKQVASHERYLSGVLLAISIAFLSTIHSIERKGTDFRLMTLLVVGGGLCRLLGIALGDELQWPVGGALVMELVVTPLLCVWQNSLVGQRPVIVASDSPGVSDAGEVRTWCRRLLDTMIDSGETIFAKLYYPRRVNPPATYVPPARWNG